MPGFVRCVYGIPWSYSKSGITFEIPSRNPSEKSDRTNAAEPHVFYPKTVYFNKFSPLLALSHMNYFNIFHCDLSSNLFTLNLRVFFPDDIPSSFLCMLPNYARSSGPKLGNNDANSEATFRQIPCTFIDLWRGEECLENTQRIKRKVI